MPVYTVQDYVLQFLEIVGHLEVLITGLRNIKMMEMSNYYNVINERLIYLDENPEKLVIHKIAPPELHLMMGAVGVLQTR